ncbi:hypothetical protein GYH30_053272 [Glycine max]|nr:hypothetical protein GYH30_053272 [Glycine max]
MGAGDDVPIVATHEPELGGHQREGLVLGIGVVRVRQGFHKVGEAKVRRWSSRGGWNPNFSPPKRARYGRMPSWGVITSTSLASPKTIIETTHSSSLPAASSPNLSRTITTT